MSVFSWREPVLGERTRERPMRGAIRDPDAGGLAAAPTAPFAQPDDAPQALPGLGVQDAFILQANLVRLRRRDPGFDPAAVAQLAAQAMVTVERAWSTLDPQPSRGVLAPALWTAHRARMELYALHGRRNVVDQLQVRDARVVAVEQDAGRDRVTVRVRASSTDYDVDASGAVVRGDTGVRTWEEDWVLERAATATNRPDGGLLGGHCPACGAPLSLDADGLCSYCRTAPTDATRDWVVVGVSDVRMSEDVLRAVLGVRTHVRSGPDDLSPRYEIDETPAALQAGGHPTTAAPLPPGFADLGVEEGAISAAARSAYVAVRHAWMAMDAAPARAVMTEEGVAALESQLSALRERGLHRVADDPIVESATPVEVRSDSAWDRVTMRVAATTVDADAAGDGTVVRGDTVPHRYSCDMVLLRRRPGDGAAPHCPRCGAPLRASISGVCEYCRAAVAGGGSEWVLDAVPQLVFAPPPAQDGAAHGEAAQAAAPKEARPTDALRARDPSFNDAELLARTRECFYAVEKALARGDADSVQPYATEHLRAHLRETVADLHAQGRHRVLAFIDVNGARIVDAASGPDGDRATVALDVSGEDCVAADADGAVVSGSDAQRRWTEAWTVTRRAPGEPWLVDEITAQP